MSYPTVNLAWQQGLDAVGQSGCRTVSTTVVTGPGPFDGGSTGVGGQIAAIFDPALYDVAASRDFTDSPAIPVTTAAPGLYHLANAVLTRMYFPSKQLGVAVGMNMGGGMVWNGAQVSTSFCNTPTILLSFDAGSSWVWSTATPQFILTPAAALYVGTAGAEAVAYPVRIL